MAEKIEKGIPFPDKEIWHRFEVGDSMKVSNYGAASNANKWAEGKEKDWRFAVRKHDGHLRIWRTK